MAIFVLVRDKKQDYCVHKKRHISIERRRDRICRKKIKIICENADRNNLYEICQNLNSKQPKIILSKITHDKYLKSIASAQLNPNSGSLTNGVKKQRMLEKKTRPVVKYTVENCRINLKKIKNVHFFDSKSDTINNDSDSVSKTLDVSSNLYEISDKSFETIDPANISHLIENGGLDNFISELDSIEIAQKVTVDSENIQESNSLGFDIQQELSNDTTSIQLENIDNVDELEYQRTTDANENGLESASNDDMQKNSQIESSFDAETEDSDSSYEPAESEGSIENEEYLVANVTEDENSDSENTGSGNVEECNNVSQNTSTSTLNCSFNVNGHAGWDDSDVEAELTVKKGNLKKDTCCFCEKEYFKIARHLETVHKSEREVQDFMKLEKKSAGRLDRIALLRKRGNHIFNMKQRRKADGTPGLLKVARCPNKTSKKGGGNYAVCSKCKGWYTKNNIRHHYRDCQNGAKSSKGILARARRIQGQIHERASDAMRHKIIPYMKLTENVKLIRYDLMIILFGNEECTKYKKRNLAQMIRGKLSLLARFLAVMKDLDSSVSDFASIYTPERYYKVIEAINKFAGLDEETGFYKVPSRASEITTNIKIGQIFINECIINKDRVKKEDVENFLSLCKQGFANIINRTVNETRITQQRNKVVELPNTTDIQRFSKFLNQRIDYNIELLKKSFSIRAWRDLAEATLIQLQLFNRKRAGEMERFELNDYKKIQFIKEGDEGYKSLSKKEKERAKEFGHTVIQGKLYKSVPLLLSAKVRDGIDFVIKYRKDARVSSRNPHVFGIAGYYKDAHLCASSIMRKLSNLCGADNPKLLRGTFLRKQIATKCTEMQLDSTQTSKVADYLGHDITIHKKVYQQRTRADILNMSTILLKAQDPNDSCNNSKGSIGIDSTINETENSINEDNSINADSFINADNSNNADNSINADSIDSTMSSKSRNSHEEDVTCSLDDSYLEEQPKSKTVNKIKEKSEDLIGRKKISRNRWSSEEERNIRKYFAEYIRTESYPSLSVIREIKQKYNILAKRNPDVIKTKLSNIYRLNIAKANKNANSKKSNSLEQKTHQPVKYKSASINNSKINKSELNKNSKKMKKSTDRLKIKQHIKYIFNSYINKRRVPSAQTCNEAKKHDQVLKNLEVEYIQSIFKELCRNE